MFQHSLWLYICTLNESHSFKHKITPCSSCCIEWQSSGAGSVQHHLPASMTSACPSTQPLIPRSHRQWEKWISKSSIREKASGFDVSYAYSSHEPRWCVFCFREAWMLTGAAGIWIFMSEVRKRDEGTEWGGKRIYLCSKTTLKNVVLQK